MKKVVLYFTATVMATALLSGCGQPVDDIRILARNPASGPSFKLRADLTTAASSSGSSNVFRLRNSIGGDQERIQATSSSFAMRGDSGQFNDTLSGGTDDAL